MTAIERNRLTGRETDSTVPMIDVIVRCLGFPARPFLYEYPPSYPSASNAHELFFLPCVGLLDPRRGGLRGLRGVGGGINGYQQHIRSFGIGDALADLNGKLFHIF